jgi:hypothetical protein
MEDTFVDIITSRSELIKRAIKRAFEENRDYLISKLRSSSNQFEISADTPEAAQEDDWVAIDSMSKLRAIVGGRFDTLKAKWQSAGFPVKQKKGDSIPEFVVDSSGWTDLESWLLKMGYKARLRPDFKDRVFEIKKTL